MQVTYTTGPLPVPHATWGWVFPPTQTLGALVTRRLIRTVAPVEYRGTLYFRILGHVRENTSSSLLIVGNPESPTDHLIIPMTNVASMQECNKVMKEDGTLLVLEAPEVPREERIS